MIQRETCYFCTSTFQILPILSIAATRNEDADLYIDPQFNHAEAIAERIRDSHLFHQVKVINSEGVYQKHFSHRTGILNHLQIANSYLHVNEIALAILGERISYRNMFVSSKAYMPRMVYFYYLKNRIPTNLFYFDDGVGSYYGTHAYSPKPLDKAIRRALFGKASIDMDRDLYLLDTDLYQMINPDSRQRIYKIAPFWDTVENQSIINRIFCADRNCGIPEQLIVLEEPYTDFLSEENANSLEIVYNQIITAVGRENSVVKKHPRSDKTEDERYKYYSRFDIPFEVVCMNSDMNSKTLVTYGSTATATPKMLFDQEPRVILLFRLVETKHGPSHVLEAFFTQLKSSYRDTGKVIIPRNMTELEKTLKEISKKQGDKNE